MILRNVAYYKLIPRADMLQRSEVLKSLFPKSNGCLYVKPSGNFYYRRLFNVKHPISSSSVQEISNNHLNNMHSIIQNNSELEQDHVLSTLFDINQFKTPTVTERSNKIELNDIEKKKIAGNNDDFIKSNSSLTVCWASVYRPKVFEEYTTIEFNSRNVKISNIFDTEYLVLYFNHMDIVKLIYNCRPKYTKHTIEKLEIDFPQGIDIEKDVANLQVRYFRYHPDMLVPVLYLNNNPISILLDHQNISIFNKLIDRWIPSTILPSQLEGLVADVATLPKKLDNIISLNINSNRLTIDPKIHDVGVIKNAKIEVRNQLKIVTSGIGAISNVINLSEQKYLDIWKGDFKISLKKKEDSLIEAKYSISDDNDSVVNFKMSLENDQSTDLFSAIEWQLIKQSAGSVALVRLDELDIPELDSFSLRHILSKINRIVGIDDDQILKDFEEFCQIRAWVKYYMYVIKTLLSIFGHNYLNRYFIPIKNPKYDVYIKSIKDPLFNEFMRMYNFLITDDSDELAENSLKIRQQSIYNSYFSEVQALSNIMSRSLDLLGRKNLPFPTIDRNYSWLIDGWANRDYISVLKGNKKKFNSIILNYSFSDSNPLNYDAYFEGGPFLTREKILAHEVGHHLAKAHTHGPGYEYTDKGLSSSDPKNFYVTINNVITIINDEENQKELFE